MVLFFFNLVTFASVNSAYFRKLFYVVINFILAILLGFLVPTNEKFAFSEICILKYHTHFLVVLVPCVVVDFPTKFFHANPVLRQFNSY